MKRIFGLFLVLCLVLAGSLFAFGYWLEKSYLPEFLAEHRLAGQPVKASPKIRIFPLRLELADVHWAGRVSSFDVSATVRRILIEPDLWLLCKGTLQITLLEIAQPVLEINSSAPSGSLMGALSGIGVPVIGRLHIQGGQIRHKRPAEELIVAEIQAIVRNIRPKQDAHLECDAEIGLYDDKDVSLLKGNFAIKSLARYYAPHLIFRDTAGTFTITHPGLAARLTPCRAQLAGAINLKTGLIRLGETMFASPLGTARLSGETIVGKQEFAGKIKFVAGDGDTAGDGGGLVLDSSFLARPHMIFLQGAALSVGNIQAVGNLAVNLDDPQKLAQFEGDMAGGSVRAGLAWSGKDFHLRGNGENISLGEILTQAGLPGLSGGATKFQGDFHFGGSDAAVMRKSVAGGGTWHTEKLALEPFGELRLLLPLLGGASKAVPEKIERMEFSLKAENGILVFSPINAIGPNFTCQGNLSWNLTDHRIKGAVVLKTPGLQIPVALSGTWEHLGVSIDPDLLKGLP